MTWTSPPRPAVAASFALVLAGLPVSFLPAQGIPHNQDRPPGPALSPEEARKNITVPEGFRVEIFASEPDIVNPVTMCFDEKGRIWIAESLEYPRRDPGPGRDRIKVLEDTDSDGKADKFTVFADGLNIPCGVAVGHGGVFVTNSPDILFLEDTDGDGKADRREVVVTGFGRSDTHELPNTLTWGPDGWLYGLNGVFNPARVKHQGKEHEFDAALWRLHPRTLDFELFAEGTSNPWGLAFDQHGSAFVSACVIDHLFHLAEGGYYVRQAGAYPPFTWRIESIVDHRHQKAAYCGLAIYDADVYPEKYRDRIFMGNIHGNCVNMDRLEQAGSSYAAKGEPDFLSANDAWFMPVAVKLAPDGCFYVLDWYDRYHCYQDANRDPKGIDRVKGRLYRIAYGEAPRAPKFDLGAENYSRVIERLGSPNRWWREEARRRLASLLPTRKFGEAEDTLRSMVLDETAPPKRRLEALWTLISAEDPGKRPRLLNTAFHLRILSLDAPDLRAWGVRAAGNARDVAPEVLARVKALASDSDPRVRLQVATAAPKLLDPRGALDLVLDVLAASKGDALIPKVAWRRMEPLLDDSGERLAAWLEADPARLGTAAGIIERSIEKLLAAKSLRACAAVVDIALRGGASAGDAPVKALEAIARAFVRREVSGEKAAEIRQGIEKRIREVLEKGKDDRLYFPALAIAAAWRDPAALEESRRILLDEGGRKEDRTRALEALLASRDASVVDAAGIVLRGKAPEDFAREVILGLGKIEGPEPARILLAALPEMRPSLRPQAIDVLTGRPEWAAALIDAIEAKSIERTVLNVNQVRRLLAHDDEKLEGRVTAIWGQVRAERNPEREKVIARMRRLIAEKPGDPRAGMPVYEKTCGQCHLLFGKGNVVGPDITVNGRETLDAILTNLLDPNLVIGKGYEGWTLLTEDGRALSGLLVEDSPNRVVLKVAGGKEEVVPRAEVKTLEKSEVSLMPEDLEKTLSEEEFRNLVAYLRLEKGLDAPAKETPPGGR